MHKKVIINALLKGETNFLIILFSKVVTLFRMFLLWFNSARKAFESSFSFFFLYKMCITYTGFCTSHSLFWAGTLFFRLFLKVFFSEVVAFFWKRAFHDSIETNTSSTTFLVFFFLIKYEKIYAVFSVSSLEFFKTYRSFDKNFPG